ncbi:MAG TPA: PLDc N-terminal domain-containing protein, partial [Solirubrobacterales bacterium]
MLLADFTFGQALLTVLEVFLFAAWLIILFVIIGDLFRDHSVSGWGKAFWVIFLIFVPFLAALVYLIARGDGMRERSLHAQQEQQKQMDAYIRQTAGSGGTAAD